jgi:DNA ligase-1
MTLLARLVSTSAAVAATPARLTKVSELADLLGDLDADEIPSAVGFLTGELRQGRVGVGWSTISQVDVIPATDASISIADVDHVLEELTVTSGPGSASARGVLLADLLGRATEDEQTFLRRLLVGELRQGALEGVMVEAVAKAAAVPPAVVRRAHMLGGRLGPTAVAALTGNREALEAVGLELLRPVRPMLASTASDVAAAVSSLGEASVEWKLDGARIQVHRIGDEVAVFTRNLRNITSRLPEVVDVARALPVTSIVLDGETLTMGEDERPRTFQDTMARLGADEVRPELLRPWFFDCLHVDGTDLIDHSLIERLAVLEQVAPAFRIPGIVTSDVAEAEAMLVEALAAGHEGVMVKGTASRYEAGRRGKAWQKVKPVHTLDLLVLASEWGHGRRRGWLSNLHLGAIDPDGGPPVMVGKTFKGLTDELLRWQTDAFLARETGRSGPGDLVVHIRPELVVEIAIDGVQRSTRYPGGVALRFTRVVRYRPDKDPADADPITAVQAFLNG